MRAFAILLTSSCVLSLAGCATTAINEGSGYAMLTPLPATAKQIVANDRTFAEQVASHNRQCKADQGCVK